MRGCLGNRDGNKEGVVPVEGQNPTQVSGCGQGVLLKTAKSFKEKNTDSNQPQ